MTATLTLATWLEEQLAADEAVAKRVSQEVASRSAQILADESYVVRLSHPPLPGLAAAMEEGAVILRLHNPAHVLAQIAAVREVVRLARECEREGYDNAAAYLQDALRALAKPYADRPGYAEVAG